MAAWCGHDCDGPIDCPVHGLHMTAHWSHLCRDREDYRRLWQQGRGPGQSSGGPAASHVAPVLQNLRPSLRPQFAGSSPPRRPCGGKTVAAPASARDEAPPANAAEKESFRGQVLARQSVEGNRQAVEDRLAVCLDCPADALRADDALGIHCVKFCRGCSGNWGIMLVKRLADELPRRQPCPHWPA